MTEARGVETPKKVLIIGAGFSGLTLAYFLLKKGVSVRVLEQAPRVGGLISTEKIEMDGRTLGLVETAANGMLSNAVIEELSAYAGVPLLETKKESRKRFIWRAGRACRWPLSLVESLLFFQKLFLALILKKMKPTETESLQQWGERVLGRKATDFILAPALQGIYAGDLAQMNASLVLARFFNKKFKKHRGQLKGTVAPKDGMGALMKGLYSKLLAEGVRFEFSSEAAAEIKKSVSGGEVPVLATNLSSALELLAPMYPELVLSGKGIEILPLVTSTLFFKKDSEVVNGFGCLFPKSERMNSLGVLVNSCIFESRVDSDFISETWILGGAHEKNRVLRDDQTLLSLIEEDRRKMGRNSKVVSYQIQRWPEALPHFTGALKQFIHNFEKIENKKIWLTGNYMGSPGLSQIALRNQQLADEISNLRT